MFFIDRFVTFFVCEPSADNMLHFHFDSSWPLFPAIGSFVLHGVLAFLGLLVGVFSSLAQGLCFPLQIIYHYFETFISLKPILSVPLHPQNLPQFFIFACGFNSSYCCLRGLCWLDWKKIEEICKQSEGSLVLQWHWWMVDFKSFQW